MNRLVDMGIADYAVRNAVRLIIAQRLVRRLCTCAQGADVEQHARPLGLNTTHCRIAVGCDECRGTGYSGRCLIAEWRDMTLPQESPQTELPARDLWTSAETLVEAGITSPLEVIRVLGFRR